MFLLRFEVLSALQILTLYGFSFFFIQDQWRVFRRRNVRLSDTLFILASILSLFIHVYGFHGENIFVINTWPSIFQRYEFHLMYKICYYQFIIFLIPKWSTQLYFIITSGDFYWLIYKQPVISTLHLNISPFCHSHLRTIYPLLYLIAVNTIYFHRFQFDKLIFDYNCIIGMFWSMQGNGCWKEL